MKRARGAGESGNECAVARFAGFIILSPKTLGITPQRFMPQPAPRADDFDALV
jgi:hypothetical protein